MSRRARMVVLAVGVLGVGVLFVLSAVRMPDFGGHTHPYRDRSITAAVRHQTANAVSSVNFDQRAMDTLGEESILLASVVGAAVLLRPSRQERERQSRLPSLRSLDAVRFAGYVVLPVTLVIGFDLVAHGQLTPGGGFQGGVVLSTGLHVTSLVGSYPALERIRPGDVFEQGEAMGAAAFVALGIAGLISAGAFLGNVVPLGHFGNLVSGGIVPLLNIAVGVEVASGAMVLLAQFFDQALVILDRAERDGNSPLESPMVS